MEHLEDLVLNDGVEGAVADSIISPKGFYVIDRKVCRKYQK